MGRKRNPLATAAELLGIVEQMQHIPDPEPPAEPQGISVRFSPDNPPPGVRYKVSGVWYSLLEPEAGERG